MVAGFAEKKQFVGSEALFEPTNSGAGSFCPNAWSPDELHVAIKISNESACRE
jgi:hypothetical protein